MANPPKQKGTQGETELLRELANRHVYVKRTSPGMNYDLVRYAYEPVIQALATRPDYGQWLVTMDLDAFAMLVPVESTLQIEVKRYKRFAHHGIYTAKFGGKT